jgi:hypothetical protein
LHPTRDAPSIGAADDVRLHVECESEADLDAAFGHA